MFSVFNQAQTLVLGAAMQIVGIFSSVMSRFGVLDAILTLVLVLIFIRRLFGRYSSGSSDTAKKSQPKQKAVKK